MPDTVAREEFQSLRSSQTQVQEDTQSSRGTATQGGAYSCEAIPERDVHVTQQGWTVTGNPRKASQESAMGAEDCKMGNSGTCKGPQVRLSAHLVRGEAEREMGQDV